MKKLALALIVALTLAGPAFAQQPSPQDAKVTALEQLIAQTREKYGENYFLLADLRQQLNAAREEAAKARAGSATRVRGYSLVLLLGDAQIAPLPEGLSGPARKALADVKDFLPYKGFRILDTQWLAGNDSGGMSTGRLRGIAEGSVYTYTLGFSRLNQSFKLFSESGTLILDTAFTERPGETVVVGTSRVQGDRALVVLFSIVTDSEVFVPGNGVTAPVAVRLAKPRLTPEVMRQIIRGDIRGEVGVSFIVRADGSAADIEITRSLDPGLDAQAVKAVQESEFKPGTKDGKPVDVRTTMTVKFTTQ